MAKGIFFSWQADTPNNIGRNFLREVLEEVCTGIASDTEVDEALRDVAVDSDTQGVAGQPPIADTIFRKIDASAVFIADLTFTGNRLDKRPTPNPNVLIEYGWALKALTSQRVICVMNTVYGEPGYESLPFDLAHLRWPIRYSLAEGATPEEKKGTKQKLSKALNDAIRLSLGTIPAPFTAPLPIFPIKEPEDGPARFRGKNEALGFEDDTYRDTNNEIFLTPGPAMWLRLIPTKNPQKIWKTSELKELAMKGGLLMPLLNGSGGYSYLRASDGEGMYRADGKTVERFDEVRLLESRGREIPSVAFAFRTGEIWSIDTSLLGFTPKWIYAIEVEKRFVDGAERYSQFLRELGIDDVVLHWKAGLAGVKGRQLGYPAPPGHQWVDRNMGPICATDLIEAEGQIQYEQSASSALLPFFEKIFDECGKERPDYMIQ